MNLNKTAWVWVAECSESYLVKAVANTFQFHFDHGEQPFVLQEERIAELNEALYDRREYRSGD